jgi:hypothetical protein
LATFRFNLMAATPPTLHLPTLRDDSIQLTLPSCLLGDQPIQCSTTTSQQILRNVSRTAVRKGSQPPTISSWPKPTWRAPSTYGCPTNSNSLGLSLSLSLSLPYQPSANIFGPPWKTGTMMTALPLRTWRAETASRGLPWPSASIELRPNSLRVAFEKVIALRCSLHQA